MKHGSKLLNWLIDNIERASELMIYISKYLILKAKKEIEFRLDIMFMSIDRRSIKYGVLINHMIYIMMSVKDTTCTSGCGDPFLSPHHRSSSSASQLTIRLYMQKLRTFLPTFYIHINVILIYIWNLDVILLIVNGALI